MKKHQSVDIPGEMLERVGIRKTKKRSLILDIIAESSEPLTHPEIQDIIEQRYPLIPMNRVTIYRILDLLVGNGLLNRISSPDHTDRYCLGESRKHPGHAHFYCTVCKQMQCVGTEEISWNLKVKKGFGGRIEMFQILIDGTCQNCVPAV